MSNPGYYRAYVALADNKFLFFPQEYLESLHHCQVAAWFELVGTGTKLVKNPHSWFVFLFTGLHGLHILAGLAGLGYLLVRTRERVSGPRYQMYTRVIARGVAIYWHYLDFLWLLMFTLLLLWKQ